MLLSSHKVYLRLTKWEAVGFLTAALLLWSLFTKCSLAVSAGVQDNLGRDEWLFLMNKIFVLYSFLASHRSRKADVFLLLSFFCIIHSWASLLCYWSNLRWKSYYRGIAHLYLEEIVSLAYGCANMFRIPSQGLSWKGTNNWREHCWFLVVPDVKLLVAGGQLMCFRLEKRCLTQPAWQSLQIDWECFSKPTYKLTTAFAIS